MTEFRITYSLQDEIERVKFTLSKLDWYEENKYVVNVPSGLTKDSSDAEIAKAVADQYVESEYEHTALLLQKSWADFSQKFEEIKSKNILKLNDLYIIKLTKYGTNGSYYPSESKVIFKIKGELSERMLGTIVHEVIHISIEPLIQEFNIRHWHKERLVDLITETCFPGLKPLQKLREDVSMVDESFNKNFPDIRKTISTLAD